MLVLPNGQTIISSPLRWGGGFTLPRGRFCPVGVPTAFPFGLGPPPADQGYPWMIRGPGASQSWESLICVHHVAPWYVRSVFPPIKSSWEDARSWETPPRLSAAWGPAPARPTQHPPSRYPPGNPPRFPRFPHFYYMIIYVRFRTNIKLSDRKRWE